MSSLSVVHACQEGRKGRYSTAQKVLKVNPRERWWEETAGGPSERWGAGCVSAFHSAWAMAVIGSGVGTWRWQLTAQWSEIESAAATVSGNSMLSAVRTISRSRVGAHFGVWDLSQTGADPCFQQVRPCSLRALTWWFIIVMMITLMIITIIDLTFHGVTQIINFVPFPYHRTLFHAFAFVLWVGSPSPLVVMHVAHRGS